MTEEIRAQAAVGYRTGLIHVNSRLVGRQALGIEPRLRRCLDEGLAELILPGEEAHARLALLRNATVFEDVPEPEFPVRADRALLVANHVAVNAAGVRHYRPAMTDHAVRSWLGPRPTWYTIGPAVRRSLGTDLPDIVLADEDWVNLIDVDEWAVPRHRRITGPPTIGRHSRSAADKWPEDAAALLAAYPDTGEVGVRVLGGADPVQQILGSIPASWVVEEFGARDPRDFLAGLDFFIYFHRSDLVEAYGRTIMEAMASGAVVILPKHFRESFGDAALYTAPAGVQPLVRRLSADSTAYHAQSRLGQDFVRRTHGHEVHVARLEAMIGPPDRPRVVTTSRRRPRERSRVLLISSNGAGMGHLTRLLSMANRASDRVAPMFFSLSQAVPVVERFGHPWEYCPSRGDLDCTTVAWNAFFSDRYAQILRRYEPHAIVFDGTMPYQGIVKLRHSFPEVLYVWSRRGMWRPETTTKYLPAGEVFDLIIEPGEVASTADLGPTAHRTDAVRVDPVTLLDQADLLDRQMARRELGMDPDAPALLLSLGAGNINEIGNDIEVFAAAAEALTGGWDVYATKVPIARSRAPLGINLRPLSVYPLSRYLPAFDSAVVAAGYNSYHEVLMAGLPTVFVPNLATITDDQAARATYAEEQGIGLAVRDVTPEAALEALTSLADADRAASIRQAALSVYPQNGAQTAMRLVEAALAERGVLQ